MDATNQHSQPKRHHTNAFLFYSHEQFKQNKERSHPVNMADIGNRWKLLSEGEKQRFLDMEQMSSEQYFLVKSDQPTKARHRRIQTRTSMGPIVRIAHKLNEQQRQAVTEIGLGGLLGIRCTQLNLELCEFLVDNFNPNSCCLNVHDRQFNLTLNDVSNILGIRSNGLDIDIRASLEGLNSLYESVGVVNGVIPLCGLRSYLEDEKTVDAGDEFKRNFTLYVLGALLCPTTKASLNLSFLHYVKDIEVMKNCNWGNLTLHSLVCGIGTYQHRRHVNVSGCLFLLMLFYLDNVSPTFKTTYGTMRSIPRLNDWGDSQLRKTFQLFRKLGGFHNEVEVTFAKPKEMNDRHVDVGKLEIHDEMRNDIGELKHTMHEVKEKIMNFEQKANEPGDGVETHRYIGELKDVVYNLKEVIIRHIIHQDPLTNAQGRDHFNSDMNIMKKRHIVDGEGVVVEKDNGEESDGPSIQLVGVKRRALKKGGSGQAMKDKEAIVLPTVKHISPILGSQRARGRGGPRQGRGRGRNHKVIKSSSMHATTQSVDVADTLSSNDYVAPTTRSKEERRPAPHICSPFLAEGVKKVQKVNRIQRRQTTDMPSDHDKDEDATTKNMGKFLDNILGVSAIPIHQQSTLISEINPLTSLTTEEERMVKFVFDENCILGDSLIELGLHFTNKVEFATRKILCCLKPYAWICSTVINLVVIELANKQRTKYPDGRHRIWYMPEYASQMIIKNKEYEGNNERVADIYFKRIGYTGPIDACEEIYIPFNYNNDHWLCLKIDMVLQTAYLFDSKPSPSLAANRKNMGELLVENIHEVLQHAYGLGYSQDVNLFTVQWLTEQPLQSDEDCYDCGLFVIKYMQNAPMSPGVQMFDAIERRRLLVDLLKSVNNRSEYEFTKHFDMYSMRDDRIKDILESKKATVTDNAAQKVARKPKRAKK